MYVYIYVLHCFLMPSYIIYLIEGFNIATIVADASWCSASPSPNQRELPVKKQPRNKGVEQIYPVICIK